MFATIVHTLYLMCGPRQLFIFQCSSEKSLDWRILEDHVLGFLALRAAHVTDLTLTLTLWVAQPGEGYITEEVIINGLMMIES